MKASVLPATLMMIVGCTACSGDYSLSSIKPEVTATKIETAKIHYPHIPAVVITARRMSAAEKRAYDQENYTMAIALERVRQP